VSVIVGTRAGRRRPQPHKHEIRMGVWYSGLGIRVCDGAALLLVSRVAATLKRRSDQEGRWCVCQNVRTKGA